MAISTRCDPLDMDESKTGLCNWSQWGTWQPRQWKTVTVRLGLLKAFWDMCITWPLPQPWVLGKSQREARVLISLQELFPFTAQAAAVSWWTKSFSGNRTGRVCLPALLLWGGALLLIASLQWWCPMLCTTVFGWMNDSYHMPTFSSLIQLLTLKYFS